MKLVLYEWNTNGIDILHDNLVMLGHEVTIFSEEVTDFDEDVHFYALLQSVINDTGCDAVFSYNYFPIIANVCEASRILYISWIFDCPHSTLLNQSVFLKGNRIFAFDREMVRELQSYGAEHVYHMSLAVDSAYFDQIIQNQTPEEKNSFTSEISFVGGLYTGDKDFYSQIHYLPEYCKGYLDALTDAQMLVYGYNFVKEMLSGEVLSELKKYVHFDFGERYFIPYENVIATMLNKRVTMKERECVLRMLSEDFSIDLYTGSDTGNLPHVHNKGYVDYNTQMPKVFHNSRINLNITLKSITSGIPLRALDIMGCGGFLLSNYQPELAENFVDGQELVLYTDMEDLKQKVHYYLVHDEERMSIANRGYEKVKKEYSFESKLSEIIRLSFA